MSELPFPEVTHPRKRAFLAAVQETGNVRLACKSAKVGRSTHYSWLKKDPAYHEAVGIAKEVAADNLEAEAYRRAVEGVEEPVGWYKGVAGGTVTRYSDTLLMFLLTKIRPEYRERMEVHGSLANLNLNELPDELLLRIVQVENPPQSWQPTSPNSSSRQPSPRARRASYRSLDGYGPSIDTRLDLA